MIDIKLSPVPLGHQVIILQSHIDRFKNLLDQPGIGDEYKVIFLTTMDDLITAKWRINFIIEDIKGNLCNN